MVMNKYYLVIISKGIDVEKKIYSQSKKAFIYHSRSDQCWRETVASLDKIHMSQEWVDRRKSY